MFHKKTEAAMPLTFMLLAVVTFLYTLGIPKDDGMFLKLIAIIIFVTAVGILYFTLKEKKNTVNLEGADVRKVIVTIIILGLYTVSLKWVGYIAATFLLGVFTIRFLNYKFWPAIIGFSALVTALSYGVFQMLLGVPLPAPFFL